MRCFLSHSFSNARLRWSCMSCVYLCLKSTCRRASKSSTDHKLCFFLPGLDGVDAVAALWWSATTSFESPSGNPPSAGTVPSPSVLAYSRTETVVKAILVADRGLMDSCAISSFFSDNGSSVSDSLLGSAVRVVPVAMVSH